MLEQGEKLFAYRFQGYWKDVGTITSLWDANMDLLSPTSGINIYDTAWPIYTHSAILPAQFIGSDAVLSHCLVTDGARSMAPSKTLSSSTRSRWSRRHGALLHPHAGCHGEGRCRGRIRHRRREHHGGL